MDNNEDENKKENKGLLKQFISHISKLNIKNGENTEIYCSKTSNSNHINLKSENNKNTKLENVNDLYYYIKFPNESNKILFITLI